MHAFSVGSPRARPQTARRRYLPRLTAAARRMRGPSPRVARHGRSLTLERMHASNSALLCARPTNLSGGLLFDRGDLAVDALANVTALTLAVAQELSRFL